MPRGETRFRSCAGPLEQDPYQHPLEQSSYRNVSAAPSRPGAGQGRAGSPRTAKRHTDDAAVCGDQPPCARRTGGGQRILLANGSVLPSGDALNFGSPTAGTFGETWFGRAERDGGPWDALRDVKQKSCAAWVLDVPSLASVDVIAR